MKFSEAYNIPKGELIGLSLCYCVRDICNGMYKLEEVACIVAGTRCRNDDDILEVIGIYLEIYQGSSWHKFPDQAADVAIELWTTNRIAQPRVDTSDVSCVDSPDRSEWTRNLHSCLTQ